MRFVSREAASFFDERATAYDSGYESRGSDGYAVRARMNTVLRIIGSGHGAALDVGMGPGRLLGELAARGWSVSGVDAAEGMVAAARRRLPHAASRLVCSRMEVLPFDDNSFDLVVATGSLEYGQLDAALAQLARVLRPGGLAVVSYVNARAFYGLWKTRVFYPVVEFVKRLAGHQRVRPRGQPNVTLLQFRALLTRVGLEPQLMKPTSFLAVPSPLDAMLPGVAERVGHQLEGSGPRVSAMFATQYVFAARKR